VEERKEKGNGGDSIQCWLSLTMLSRNSEDVRGIGAVQGASYAENTPL
jgi:hypothetical protein